MAVILTLVSEALPPSKGGERELETIIVREQLRRARTVQPTVLIIGDSSALMDVEARKLSSILRTDVESLATLAWVGPEGYGRLMEMLSERSAAPRVVVLLMCGAGLIVDESTFDMMGYERMALETSTDWRPGARPARRQRSYADMLLAARNSVYRRLYLPLVYAPLPGRLGSYYGWPEDVARVIDQSQGSLVDPTLPDRAALSTPFRFAVSDAVERRLRALAAAIRANGVQSAYFGITPVPHSAVVDGTLASRAATVRRCLEALGLKRSAELPLPADLPADRFATFNHLGAEGRQEYSRLVAQAVKPRLSRPVPLPHPAP